MEKTLRVLSGEDSSGHSHSHSHSQGSHADAQDVSGTSSAIDTQADGLRSRGSAKSNGDVTKEQPDTAHSSPSKLSAYLNLFGDFVHNMSVSWVH
jgi:zinc transporter 7